MNEDAFKEVLVSPENDLYRILFYSRRQLKTVRADNISYCTGTGI